MFKELLSLRNQGGVLSALTEDELRDLAAHLVEELLAEGETLLAAGTPIERVYVVLEGRLAALAHSEENAGSEREIGPGAVLGIVELVAGGHHADDVRALGASRLGSLSRDSFQHLLDKSPETWRRVSERVLTTMHRQRLSTHLNELFGPFGIFEEDILEHLEGGIELVTLRGGETLFRQGGPPDAVYILISGRLRVVLEGPDGSETPVNEVASGETVGELALLTDIPRSATVFAVRDSELARLPRREFFRLIERRPRSMMKLSRLIVERLQRRGLPEPASRAPVTAIGLVPTAPSAPIAELARGLARALSAYGSVAILESAGVDASLGRSGIAQVAASEPAYLRLAQWLHEREEAFQYLVYQADPTWSPWTERCASQADQLLFVADVDDGPDLGEVEHRLAARWRQRRAPRCSLVILHLEREPSGTARWLDNRELDDHHHLRRGSEQDYARLARYLTGHAVALVLGGGGARGLAHAGVIQALSELGIPIDLIGGTSIGASIAAFYTVSHDWRQLQSTVGWAFHNLLDYTFPSVSLIRGSRALANAVAGYGDRQIEDLWIPYFAVSTNLTRSEQVVHRRGSLLEAVKASIAIPGVFPPVYYEGDYLIDGGMLNNVPVDVMRSSAAAGTLIAVDVTFEGQRKADPRIDFGVSGWKLLANRLNPWAQRIRGPSILSLLVQSTVVGSVSKRNQQLDLADLYLELPVREWGMLEFEASEAIIKRGYEASHEPLETWWRTRQASSTATEPPRRVDPEMAKPAGGQEDDPGVRRRNQEEE